METTIVVMRMMQRAQKAMMMKLMTEAKRMMGLTKNGVDQSNVVIVSAIIFCASHQAQQQCL